MAYPDSFTRPLSDRQHGLSLRVASETRRVLGQHRQLSSFFDLVQDGLERQSMQSTRLAFTRFRDAVEAHIEVEDDSWFPALRGLRPNLATQLAQLVLDHARYRQELEELWDLLARGSAEEFSADFTRFCDDFALHEGREEALSTLGNGDH